MVELKDNSPAARALAEEGGAIVPSELGGLRLEFKENTLQIAEAPVTPPSETTPPVKVKGVIDPDAEAAIEKPPEQVFLEESLLANVNIQLNIFNAVLMSTKNLIRDQIRNEPIDSAEFAQFSAGQRAPLELAEPYIAIEVYRHVVRGMEDDERARDGFWAKVGRLLSRFIRKTPRRREQEEPVRPVHAFPQKPQKQPEPFDEA